MRGVGDGEAPQVYSVSGLRRPTSGKPTLPALRARRSRPRSPPSAGKGSDSRGRSTTEMGKETPPPPTLSVTRPPRIRTRGPRDRQSEDERSQAKTVVPHSLQNPHPLVAQARRVLKGAGWVLERIVFRFRPALTRSHGNRRGSLNSRSYRRMPGMDDIAARVLSGRRGRGPHPNGPEASSHLA